jgi:transcriptional regulator with GAF, ATPase, and Fis domain
VFWGGLARLHIQILEVGATAGKSVIFLVIVEVGYIAGVIHKLLYSMDAVIGLYALNAAMVLIDIALYCRNAARQRNIAGADTSPDVYVKRFSGMDHVKLLCDISELNNLFRDSISVENFMQRTVEMVAHHMQADVCSVYLYEEERDLIVLKATFGLNPDSVGKVTMRTGEGLTGLALKDLKPVCVSNASSHPNYRSFPETGEEPFENFLAVPITRGTTRIGVLVLQRKKRRRFTDADAMACKAVASQLANIIENAKFLLDAAQPCADRKERFRTAAANSSS